MGSAKIARTAEVISQSCLSRWQRLPSNWCYRKQKQVASFCEAALEDGIDSNLLDEVICPIGLNIGAESPEEIAIAVTAQILSLAKGVSPSDDNWRQSL